MPKPVCVYLQYSGTELRLSGWMSACARFFRRHWKARSMESATSSRDASGLRSIRVPCWACDRLLKSEQSAGLPTFDYISLKHHPTPAEKHGVQEDGKWRFLIYILHSAEPPMGERWADLAKLIKLMVIGLLESTMNAWLGSSPVSDVDTPVAPHHQRCFYGKMGWLIQVWQDDEKATRVLLVVYYNMQRIPVAV